MIVLISAPVTGQTPLYSNQMQPWAEQHIYDKGIECYCLDAPDRVPTGRTLPAFSGFRPGGAAYGQAEFVSREGY